MAQTPLSGQKNLWAVEYREAVTAFEKAWERMQALETEFQARGWSGNISDDDLQGVNAGMTYTLLANALGSHSAIATMMAAGHATNLQGIRLRQ